MPKKHLNFFQKNLYYFLAIIVGGLYFGYRSLLHSPNIAQVTTRPTLAQVCKSELTSISYTRGTCDSASAKTARYTCLDASYGTVGDDQTCQTKKSLETRAKKLCESPHICPTAVPQASCTPRPACLDATPRCNLPVTPDMCPSLPSPTPIIYYDPKPTSTPLPSNCHYEPVQCIKAPCRPILVCSNIDL